MILAKNGALATPFMCTWPAHTLPSHLTPRTLCNSINAVGVGSGGGGDALPILVPGCHLLAESGLAETGPLALTEASLSSGNENLKSKM